MCRTEARRCTTLLRLGRPASYKPCLTLAALLTPLTMPRTLLCTWQLVSICCVRSWLIRKRKAVSCSLNKTTELLHQAALLRGLHKPLLSVRASLIWQESSP